MISRFLIIQQSMKDKSKENKMIKTNKRNLKKLNRKLQKLRKRCGSHFFGNAKNFNEFKKKLK